MQITVFNGSPRGKNGNTHRMVQEFMKGAQEAGAEVENVFLVAHEIRPCAACFSCWIKTPGKCVVRDDMDKLLPKVACADIVVFATPLYVDNVSGLMKHFMDRFIPLIDPHFEKDPNGEFRHVKRLADPPKIAVIANCGFPEHTHFQVLRLLFRRMARNFQSEVIAEIYRGGGELLGAGNPLLKPLLAEYNRLLRKAGREVVETGRLSEQTAAALEKPIVPHDQYINGANKHWDKALRRLHGN